MTSDQRKQLLSRFEMQESLTEAEQLDLQRYLQNRPEAVRDIMDARAVDGLLQLLASGEADEDRFVSACIDKLNADRSPSISAPTVSDLPAIVPVSGPVVISPAEARSRSTATSVKQPVNHWRGVFMWSAIAALILVALGVWSGLIWPRQTASDIEVAEKPPLPNRIAQSRDMKPALEIAGLPNNSPDPATENKSQHQPVLASQKPDEPVVDDVDEFVAAPDEDSLAIVDTAQAPAATDHAGTARPAAEQRVERLPGQEESVELPFANVSTGNEGGWAGADPGPRIGTGKLQLLRGNATVELDNGTLIKFLAPAELELVSDHYVRIQDGSYYVDIPRTVTSVVIETPHGVLQEPSNARLQLIVDATEGMETLVTRGRIGLAHSGTGGFQNRLEMSKNQLFQSVIRPVKSCPSASPVVMARGEQDFMGQIGSGQDLVTTTSPLIFANVIHRVSEPTNAMDANDDMSKTWSQFAKDFQALASNVDSPEFQAFFNQFIGQTEFVNPGKNNSDATGVGSTNFQGSMSINGIERKFNSREEFEQAQRQWMSRFWPAGSANDPEQSKTPGNFAGPLNVDGRPLEFNSLDKFKSLKKQMSR